MTEHDDPLTEVAMPRLGLSVAVMLAILIGGGLGTVARFLLDTAFVESSRQFPTVTLLINLSGSLLIGLLVPVAERLTPRLPLVRPFVVVGLLGGWTTYSTLAVGSITLLQNGRATTCILYLLATFVGGTALVVLGNIAGRRMVST
jgi:fluoride exporter